MKLVELYFSDPDQPPGKRFLGAVLMKCHELPAVELARRAWRLNINPGGEIQFYAVESGQLRNFTEAHLDRLLSEEEGLALGLFTRKEAKP